MGSRGLRKAQIGLKKPCKLVLLHVCFFFFCFSSNVDAGRNRTTMRTRYVLREDRSCEGGGGVIGASLAIVDKQWLHGRLRYQQKSR